LAISLFKSKPLVEPVEVTVIGGLVAGGKVVPVVVDGATVVVVVGFVVVEEGNVVVVVPLGVLASCVTTH
jgi:hypothetical protein